MIAEVGLIELAGQLSIEGKTVIIDGLQIFVKGEYGLGGAPGISAYNSVRNALGQDLAKQGYDEAYSASIR